MWIAGFAWKGRRPVCGSKKSRGQGRWKCSHTKGTSRAHPKKVENIGMEEKITLPKVLPCPTAPFMIDAWLCSLI